MPVTGFDGCNRDKLEAGACWMHVTGSDGSYGVGSKVNPYYGRNEVQLNLKACKLCATGF